MGLLEGMDGCDGVFRTCEWFALSVSLLMFRALSLGVVVSIVRCEREGMSEVEEEEDIRRGGIWEVGVAHDVNPTETERKEGRKEERVESKCPQSKASPLSIQVKEEEKETTKRDWMDGRGMEGIPPTKHTVII